MNQDEVYAFRDRVMELLDYNPYTGKFSHKTSRGGKTIGNEAGTTHSGYRRIEYIDRKTSSAHRLAFLIMTGQFPMQELDHIDNNRLNNSFNNLREATHSENMRNKQITQRNTSNLIGVSLYRKTNKWRARISVDGLNYHLGYFDNPITAAETRDLAAIRLHLQFARLNFTYTLTENNQIVRYTDF